ALRIGDNPRSDGGTGRAAETSLERNSRILKKTAVGGGPTPPCPAGIPDGIKRELGHWLIFFL
ncbi:MAG: hypothetical protein WCS42_21940, partial [Verrucomicrobiota bacterium]